MIVPEAMERVQARNAFASDSARLVSPARPDQFTAKPLDFSPRSRAAAREESLDYTNGEEAWCKDSVLSTRCAPCWASYARSVSTRFASKQRRRPACLIVAPTADEARRLGLAVTGPEGQFATIIRGVDEPIESVGHVDAAVVWDPERTGAGSRVAEALRFESPPVPIVRFEGSGPEDRDAIDRLRADIMKRNAERAPAFGRALPAFRAAAAKQVIDETSAANAQFSLVSNIPAILPVIGNIAAAGADFIVLTKNQVMMLYKLAAVFGRDLRDQRTILQDVLPVVGAGLIWRTVARQAATWLPFAAGTIPKLAIAYVGTMAVGRAAEFYYRDGTQADAVADGSICAASRRAASPARSARGATRTQEERHGLGWRRRIQRYRSSARTIRSAIWILAVVQ